MTSGQPTIGVDLRSLVPEATGIGVYTRSLLAALARRGQFRFVGLSHQPARGAAELSNLGIALEVQPSPLGVLWQQLRLPKRLAQGDIDLFWSPLSILPIRCPVPAVVTVHDLTVLLMPEAHTWKVKLSQLPFLTHTLERADRVAVDSRATAADLALHFPQCAPRVRLVGCGVDADFVPGDEVTRQETRERLGAPAGYILYAGTLEPRKNLGLLLSAWERLKRDEPENTPPLLLAGAYGWGSEELVRRLEGLAPWGARRLGRVPKPELVAAMQAATIFVYPSSYEGFGLPVAEAMACGAPVVAANTSSLPEVVGDAGLLVSPEDPADLAAALARLLASEDLRAELGRKGRERAAGFTWENAAVALEQVFFEALH